MNEPNPLTPDEHEDLVSYLDHELDEPSAQALEARLTQDAAARQELDTLQRTWDLLDYLPRPQASESFTHRTLERLETGQVARARRRRWWRGFGRVSWAAAAVAASLLGFMVLYRWPHPELPEPSPDDIRLLENREHWHHFEKIDNLDFLRELEKSGLFSEDS